MNHHEQFRAVTDFQPVARLPRRELAMWWDKTIDRRHAEGLPAGLTDVLEIHDKMVMNHGEEAMRAEFERSGPLMKSGGFIPSVDHRTPRGVSLEDCRICLHLLNEYMS